jgi:hypothetical protein
MANTIRTARGHWPHDYCGRNDRNFHPSGPFRSHLTGGNREPLYQTFFGPSLLSVDSVCSCSRSISANGRPNRLWRPDLSVPPAATFRGRDCQQSRSRCQNSCHRRFRHLGSDEAKCFRAPAAIIGIAVLTKRSSSYAVGIKSLTVVEGRRGNRALQSKGDRVIVYPHSAWTDVPPGDQAVASD